MKNEIQVLGNDKQMYEVADFVAAGKSHKDAIGIVFGTPIIGLRVLAFDGSVEQWGKTDRVLTESHNEAQAVQILCGLEDTKRIVKEQTNLDELTAAKWCWSYQKGDFQWYLPSVMELGALFLVRDQVNDAMEQLGCDCLLPTENSDEIWVWSSSEGSQYYSWFVCFGNGNFDYFNKTVSYVVRAVALLSHTLFPIQGPSNDEKVSDEKLLTILRNRGYSGELTKTLKDIMGKEYILCAAIKRLKPVSVIAYNYKTSTKEQDDIYSIEIGRRHNDIMARFGKKVLDVKQQGFYTSYGRFVDRKEAMDIAKKAEQVETDNETLYSEDLY